MRFGILRGLYLITHPPTLMCCIKGASYCCYVNVGAEFQMVVNKWYKW